MKFSIVILFGLCLLPVSGRAQQYVLRMMNDGMPNPSTYEWDIYVQRTDGTVTGYATGQYVFQYNAAIVNGGTLSLSIVPGSSELANPVQIPQKGTVTSTELRVQAPPPPGYTNGSWLAMSNPGTRICRVRLTNTVPFSSVSPNLTWKTSGSPPITLMMGYIANANTVLVGSMDASGMLNPTLPVELKVFRARKENGAVRLEWETEREEHNAGFRVLRGGRNQAGTVSWLAIGFQPASGHEGGERYSWTDHPPEDISPILYRLEQIDLDGTSTLGPVIDLAVALPRDLDLGSVYPQPVRFDAWISLSSQGTAPVRLEIRNLSGALLRTLDVGIPATGTSRYSLPVLGLPTGLYYVSIAGNPSATVRSFAITH